MAGFGPLCILIASFFNRKSYWRLKSFDYFCGLCSILALVLWIVTKDANIAIFFSILSDGFAAVPTVIKAWTNPETESGMPYLTGTFSALTSFAAIRCWAFSGYAFPMYLVVVDTLLVFIIYRKQIASRLAWIRRRG